jgi:hypothetical protein
MTGIGGMIMRSLILSDGDRTTFITAHLKRRHDTASGLPLIDVGA